MRDKSTTSPQGPEGAGTSGSPPSKPAPRPFNIRRLLATAALVGAAGVGLNWYFSRRPVEITVVVEFDRSRKEVKSVKVELVKAKHVAAALSLDILSKAPKKHIQRFKVRKGRYVLRTSTLYRDGSRRRTKRKVKVTDQSRWTIRIH